MIWRDLISTAVETFIAGAIWARCAAGAALFPQHLPGPPLPVRAFRSVGPFVAAGADGSPADQLLLLLGASLAAHIDFMWKLHGYHHSVTRLQISNVLVSNPFEWAMRNVLGGLILSIVGFNPIAIVIAGGLNIYGDFLPLRRRSERRLAELRLQHARSASLASFDRIPRRSEIPLWLQLRRGRELLGHLFGTFYLPKDEKGA